MINEKDLWLLKASFNKKKGDKDYNPQADLNVDNIVNWIDRQILLANFCKRGDGYQGPVSTCQSPPIVDF